MVEDVSIITGKTKTFSVVDYVIFAGILVISASIGFYHAWKDRKNQTLKEFLLAGGNMQVFPVMLSLLASFMSAITLLGTPVEMYQYSTMYFYIGIGYMLTMAGAAHIYIPIFYRLRVTSVYEYLEKRFGRAVRTAGSLTFVAQMMLYMAIVLYAPSLALNAATGFTLWGAVVSVGSVCTIYTALGGMKAVLWTDCFQVVMMMAGLIAVLIRGSIKVGGFAAAWETLHSSGRVVFDDFSFEPNVRHSFWSLTVGGYFTWVAIYGVNQAMVQRACTCPTLRRAQLALWFNAPGLWVILFIGCAIGVVVSAFYSDCDPVSNGLIDKTDQLLPLFVMDVVGDITGLPGLFVACLFSGALSTISSGLNSIAAVIVEDVIRTYLIPDIRDSTATRTSQVLALVFGGICLALTYVASLMGNVLQAALSLFGMIAGPLLGLFTLGMIFPWANNWGALAGLVSSLALTFTMGIGAFIQKPPVRPPPFDLQQNSHCRFLVNLTASPGPVSVPDPFPSPATTTDQPDIFPMFEVSYIWIGFYAVLTVIVVGLIVSFITGHTRPQEVDPKLICPLFDILPPFCFLPEHLRKPLRFGVAHEEKYEGMKTDVERLAELDALGKRRVSDFAEQTLVVREPEQTKDSKGVDNTAVTIDVDSKSAPVHTNDIQMTKM